MTEAATHLEALDLFPKAHQRDIKSLIGRVRVVTGVNSISAAASDGSLLCITELSVDDEAQFDQVADAERATEREGKRARSHRLIFASYSSAVPGEERIIDDYRSRGFNPEVVYRRSEER